jgi:hypothetical protein
MLEEAAAAAAGMATRLDVFSYMNMREGMDMIKHISQWRRNKNEIFMVHRRGFHIQFLHE